jgi:hypothetical protein
LPAMISKLFKERLKNLAVETKKQLLNIKTRFPSWLKNLKDWTAWLKERTMK